MKSTFAFFLLLIATACFADDTSFGKATAPRRTSLWNGPAPAGDGATDPANAWITVHHPKVAANGTAIVICPGGGYGGL
ncbi:MAG: hypothetical protein ABL921_15935, partial [Pirellula sp.]